MLMNDYDDQLRVKRDINQNVSLCAMSSAPFRHTGDLLPKLSNERESAISMIVIQ